MATTRKDVTALEAEMERLRKEVRDLRAYHLKTPVTVYVPQGWWIFLDQYEVRNLQSVLEAILGAASPLSVLNSGDWIGQIGFKLKECVSDGCGPNKSPEQYIDEANRRARKSEENDAAVASGKT